MLIGKYINTLDPKGRVIIPAAFRCDLGERFILSIGIDKCLNIYPEKAWERFVGELDEHLLTSEEEYRNTIRYFSSNAVECEVDKQGRILIPQYLRKFAELDKELMFVGVFSKVEIWNPDLCPISTAQEVGNMLKGKKIKY